MKKRLIFLLAMMVALTSFVMPVVANADGGAIAFNGARISATVNYTSNTTLPMTVSSDGRTFTVTDTLGVDFEDRADGSKNDPEFNFHYSSIVSGTGKMYVVNSNYPWTELDKADKLMVSGFTKKPYNTDSYYIIWERTFYDHYTLTDDGTGTTFTIKVPKWEKQYSPEIYYDRWLKLFVWSKEMKESDFTPVAGKTGTFEYVCAKGITFPQPVKVTLAVVGGESFYVDGQKLTFSKTGQWDKEFILTKDKPYVEFKWVPSGSLDTKYKKYVTGIWRIRAEGQDGTGSDCNDGVTSPTTGGKLTDSSGKTVTVSVAGIPDRAWTGKQVKPVPAVTASGQKLTKGTDYTISYGANKNIGKGALTIKGAGKYKGSIAASFRIVPKAPTGVKLTAAAKALKVKWTTPTKFKNQQVTGYEIQYRYQDGSAWTAWKSKPLKVSYKDTAKTVTQTLKNLKAKKNYQVQVRAYKKVSGANYCSAWTKVKAKSTK